METRTAGPADREGLTALITDAFANDPLWRWAFPDADDASAWWGLYVESALRYPCVSIAGDFEAASILIPPGATELTAEAEERVEPIVRDLAGPRAGDVLELLERFEAAHPGDPPHYYLSVLGTATHHRGKGVGMALLASNLQKIDAEGIGVYLESSNPANNERYERVGFRKVGEFTTPDDARAVTTMWRAPKA